jgi:DNA-binding transcriptional LysR family regulator
MTTFDIRQLRALSAVARHGGFSRASREARITQPTLSTHIRNLENLLEVKLFDRAGRSVTLTPAGEVFLDYATRILDLCDQATEALQIHLGQMKGEIDVVASTVPGEYILPGWLTEFHREYPDVLVKLSVNDSQTVMEKVAAGETPIGIAGIEATHPSLSSTLLKEDIIVLVGTEEFIGENGLGSQINRENLDKVPLIRRESGSGTQRTVEQTLKNSGINPDKLLWTAYLGSTRAVIEGALAGMGGAFLSRFTVEKELKEGILKEIEVEDLRMGRGFFIITHSSRSLSPIAQRLLENLLQ